MAEREYKDLDKIVELPAGKYDAVRTLRHMLQQAEKGEIDDVIIICAKHYENDETVSMWANWSDMVKFEILWMARWFNSYINHRYFARHHKDN